ncbi:response regulator transcription factor [Gammaproteobacteria bacterium]|jgi:DNA-binding response OmpR family regulator|uniref:response regulator transcription factor n=1 Tax=Planktomarina sp. TaxID=2024851 RepID=UPI00230B30DC|nr:response regulator transcription factor [Gammaproteobacteria bacterium]MDA9297142.1 response regulator transcription factor [Gammaproteobacteria bacterium]MDB4155897.1 response regulator transcription factor [Gammaproteobacteria bacterium]
MRLLVVEDELRIVDILKDVLESAGFTVDAVNTATGARNALSDIPYDAAILDLGLPDGDGLEVLKSARAQGLQIPILVLTARDAINDRVSGLDAGADDYLVKPFAIQELVSRIKALLRRPGGALGAVLEAGNLAFDTIGREVTISGNPVQLSRRELSILEILLRRFGRVVPKDVLEEKLYAFDQEPESNAVSVHVHHLRRKLKTQAASVEVHTVRGIGYLLNEQ